MKENIVNQVAIRPAEPEDLQEILCLQKIAFKTEAKLHGNYNIEPLHQTYESILADFSTHSFLKVVYRERIIASVKYRNQNNVVWLGKLIVDPDFRKNGLGKRLLTEVEKSNPDASEFRLCTAASSIQNIRLYESVGYRICSEYCDMSQAGLVMVEMEKKEERNR